MKDAKQKKLTYRLIEPEDPVGTLIHDMIATIVVEHHPDLAEATIAVAWHLSRKPDKDGRMQLGSTKLVGNLERELMEHDFIVVLVKEFWDDPNVTDDQRRALLDHQLSRVARVIDEGGEPIEDERERKRYRLVKPDLQEFSAVVKRHGMYRKEIEKFYQSLQSSKQGKLFTAPDQQTDGPRAVK